MLSEAPRVLLYMTFLLLAQAEAQLPVVVRVPRIAHRHFLMPRRDRCGEGRRPRLIGIPRILQ